MQLLFRAVVDRERDRADGRDRHQRDPQAAVKAHHAFLAEDRGCQSGDGYFLSGGLEAGFKRVELALNGPVSGFEGDADELGGRGKRGGEASGDVPGTRQTSKAKRQSSHIPRLCEL